MGSKPLVEATTISNVLWPRSRRIAGGGPNATPRQNGAPMYVVSGYLILWLRSQGVWPNEPHLQLRVEFYGCPLYPLQLGIQTSSAATDITCLAPFRRC